MAGRPALQGSKRHLSRRLDFPHLLRILCHKWQYIPSLGLALSGEERWAADAPKKHRPLTAREVWKDVFKEAQHF
ncbi:hypothetical protein EFQ99_32230 [Rhizobium vallis]|uniref:Uncharacterized protein n=1 Tax=Rhizobium vallis TaxID=634290 RepID=A0A3S0QQZ7_9HYPH|nr:hypothetical protein EFQ99_32230 [Rhizobium vallis]